MADMSMGWKCKLCTVAEDTRAQLFRHCRLKHSHYSRVAPLPCLYDSCICTFQSHNALKIHLSRFHNDAGRTSSKDGQQGEMAHFTCSLCNMKQPFSHETLFSHLRSHLKKHETITCPFKNCNYQTNVYSSFNTHKSRLHAGSSDFCDVVSTESASAGIVDLGCGEIYLNKQEDTIDDPDDHLFDNSDLRAQLHHNLSSLFLKMQTVLHVSEMATQEIVEQLGQILSMSQPLIRDAVNETLQRNNVTLTETALNELVNEVMQTNIFASATTKGKEMSSTKRRKTLIEKKFPVVKPVQYEFEMGCKVAYVPILQMIQEMFKHTNILEKIKETKMSQKGLYMSHQDGSYFQENGLLSSSELTLPLLLYIDDLEIANPLGTSKKIHKLCSVYWVIADLPLKYRSALHVIQLAALCKVPDVQRYGFKTVLCPLLQDLCTLEQDGVFIESLGQSVKGTVLCVVSDNLAAHSLAGFAQSFRAGHICRFCKATRDESQCHEVGDGEFCLRTKVSHDRDLQDVLEEGSHSTFGVKGNCVLNEGLQHFHTITGFPPDILHDLLEGIVPVELALCINEMIRLKYFTLDGLNWKIKSFPYQHSDKVDKPQPISKNFAAKRTIGGNGHENNTLLRLYILRVYIANDIAVKVVLNERPTSVEELIDILRDRVKPKLDFEFTIQYEDPDFDGQLCCLLNVEDLPKKGVLRVVRSELESSSCCSSDTEILPHVPVSQRQKTWPDIFPVPTFSYDVEHVLQEGNCVYETSGKTFKLDRAQKHNILEAMAALMFSFKPYPSDRDVGMAAEALVTTHPCLKEFGSVSGWYGWKTSLKFKMGNYRTKLARSGCKVSVNTGKRSSNNPSKASPHTNIKKAGRAEVNFLPNFPTGQNQASLEDIRIKITDEIQRAEKNLQSLEKLMQMTFALRRQEIVQESPLVKDFLNRWPALRVESQVCAEFQRITNVNLRNQFYVELDRHIPRLITLYRQKASRTGKVTEVLRDLLLRYDNQDIQDIDEKRTLALCALPIYLREEDMQFVKTWNREESEVPDISDTPVGLLTVITDGRTAPIHLNPESTAIVVEDELVIMDISRFAEAYVLLFGLVYALHLNYPKKLLNTFTFVQKILMGLDDGAPLKPCLLCLKNDLLMAM